MSSISVKLEVFDGPLDLMGHADVDKLNNLF